MIGVNVCIPPESGVMDFERKFHAKTPAKSREVHPMMIPIIILLIHFFFGISFVLTSAISEGEIGEGEEGSFLVLNADMGLIIEKKAVFSKEKWVFHIFRELYFYLSFSDAVSVEMNVIFM